MADLAKTLTSLAGRPVVDETGLTGRYTLTLTFSSSLRTNESATAAALPDLFTAVQEQLGLKLQANRRDAPILVVDSAERAPSEN